MSKILITGGAGFIGYHLAKRLAAQEHEITLADLSFHRPDDSDLQALLAQSNVQSIEADLTDPASCDKLGTGYDYVYHLAGINGFKQFQEIPHEVLRVGVSSTLNILEWFRSQNKNPRAKILFASSNEVFAGARGVFDFSIPTPENVPLVIADPYNPRWSYAGSKIISELFFIHYAKAYNLRMAIARLHNIYGPRAGYQQMIPKFIERVQKRMDPLPLLGPDDMRASCYIDDMAEGMHIAAESAQTDGQTYNIGNHRETTVRDIMELICKIMEWHPEKFDIKLSPNNDTIRDILDVSKIKADTGWEARTLLEDGLRKTIEWYMAHPSKKSPLSEAA